MDDQFVPKLNYSPLSEVPSKNLNDLNYFLDLSIKKLSTLKKDEREKITLLADNWILNEETGLYEYNYTTTQYEITDNTDLDIRYDDADLDYIEEKGFTIRGKTFNGYATLNSKDKKIEQDLHCTIIYSDSVDITEQEEE